MSSVVGLGATAYEREPAYYRNDCYDISGCYAGLSPLKLFQIKTALVYFLQQLLGVLFQKIERGGQPKILSFNQKVSNWYLYYIRK